MQATPSATWSPRWNHRAVVYKDKLWVLGGKGGGNKHHNDIWCYELPATGIDFLSIDGKDSYGMPE